MSGPCLNEGILQSYCDGQLALDVLEQVTSHLATCSLCSEAAREVESEMELAIGAFAAEMALSVPSVRLRSRLDEAIAGLNAPPLSIEKSLSSRVREWVASLGSTFNLSPKRTFRFASLVVFVVLSIVAGSIVMWQRDSQTGFEVVGNQGELGELSFGGPISLEAPPNSELPEKRTMKRRAPAGSIRPNMAGSASENIVKAAHRQLPGEKNYLQAISLLTDAIEANGESSLKPTLLSDYKRNLEIVNQAITATQRTARTNPKSSDAAEMLFAVYQSKLDLLSAVAEQSQPMIAQR